MSSILYLAWRYVLHNRVKTSILVICIALTGLLPIAVGLLIDEYDRQIAARARATPLVLGVRGNRYDVVLETLYFRSGRLGPVPAGLVAEIEATGEATAIPIHARFTARQLPLIGTSLEYFELRGLTCASGRLPGILGEAVIGSAVATTRDLEPGDTLISDQQNIYDLSRTVPVKMRIVGVLAPSDSPDDHAVFVDVRTTWVIEGLGHGHADISKESPAGGVVLERDEGHVKANAALETLVEITRENLDSFHFHGDLEDFPLSSIILVPVDPKSATILKTRINTTTEYQVLVPEAVVRELMGIVFRVKAFFDANFALVALSTLLFLVLVVLLSLRLRQEERATLHRMGGSRSIILWLQTAELVIIGSMSALVAGVLSAIILWLAPNLLFIL